MGCTELGKDLEKEFVCLSLFPVPIRLHDLREEGLMEGSISAGGGGERIK